MQRFVDGSHTPVAQTSVSPVQSESSQQPPVDRSMQTGSPAEQQSSPGAQQASPFAAEQIFPVVQQVPSVTHAPSQQPSISQQLCSAPQHAPAHICGRGQQVSSPMQMVPVGQQALSQHCSADWQQVGPHWTPDGQMHWPLLQT
jgi:hypothetical protein